MSAFASLMVMRAQTIRRNASGKDTYGGQKQDVWQVVGSNVPCYVWTESEREIVNGQSVVVERIKAYFRKNADIKRGDVITAIVTKAGDALFDGPFAVDHNPDVRTMGAVASFATVSMRRHRG